jgi:hypothetical protein
MVNKQVITPAANICRSFVHLKQTVAKNTTGLTAVTNEYHIDIFNTALRDPAIIIQIVPTPNRLEANNMNW